MYSCKKNIANFNSETLETPLPENYGPNLDRSEAEEYVKNVLKQDLPKTEKATVDKELRWHFKLDKESREKKGKTNRKKKTYLTRKERKQLNLLKLPKTDWNYAALDDLRAMWKEYMRENLELEKAPSCNEPNFNSLSVILGKSEYVGAEIKVIRSTCPSLIGICGTVVLETKATFQIVNKESKLKSKTTC